MTKLTQYLSDESGASAAEYALILALIAAAIIFALTSLGSNIGKVLNLISGDIGNATTAS
jgi:pilus assembly protein Flp/PilA